MKRSLFHPRLLLGLDGNSRPSICTNRPRTWGFYSKFSAVFNWRVLVMFMACGFCMLESGLVGRKTLLPS